MGIPDRVNNPYHSDLEPLLTTDSTVELQPDNGSHVVAAVEVLPSVTTQEFTVPANDSLNDEEIRSLYGQDGVLVQLRLPDPAGADPAIPEGVDIAVDHGGQESPRFNIKNQRGVLTADTPTFGDAAQQTEIFQYEDTDLFFDVENSTDEEVTFDLTWTGWAYDLRPVDLDPAEADVTVLTERKSLRGN